MYGSAARCTSIIFRDVFFLFSFFFKYFFHMVCEKVASRCNCHAAIQHVKLLSNWIACHFIQLYCLFNYTHIHKHNHPIVMIRTSHQFECVVFLSSFVADNGHRIREWLFCILNAMHIRYLTPLVFIYSNLLFMLTNLTWFNILFQLKKKWCCIIMYASNLIWNAVLIWFAWSSG